MKKTVPQQRWIYRQMLALSEQGWYLIYVPRTKRRLV
jgi:hypothetical protein